MGSPSSASGSQGTKRPSPDEAASSLRIAPLRGEGPVAQHEIGALPEKLLLPADLLADRKTSDHGGSGDTVQVVQPQLLEELPIGGRKDTEGDKRMLHEETAHEIVLVPESA